MGFAYEYTYQMCEYIIRTMNTEHVQRTLLKISEDIVALSTAALNTITCMCWWCHFQLYPW